MHLHRLLKSLLCTHEILPTYTTSLTHASKDSTFSEVQIQRTVHLRY
jgi:hypothetical protein